MFELFILKISKKKRNSVLKQHRNREGFFFKQAEEHHGSKWILHTSIESASPQSWFCTVTMSGGATDPIDLAQSGGELKIIQNGIRRAEVFSKSRRYGVSNSMSQTDTVCRNHSPSFLIQNGGSLLDHKLEYMTMIEITITARRRRKILMIP